MFPAKTSLSPIKHLSNTLLALTLLTALSWCSEALGQSLILRDGSRIEKGQFEVKGDKIVRTIVLGNGQKAQVNINTSDIDSLDWPDVPELLEAQNQLSAGKVQDAVATLQKTKEFFDPFKTISGSPYQQVAMAYVEALDQAGDFDTLLRALPEVEKMEWDKQNQLKLQIIKLNMQRRTSSNHEEILAQAKNILSGTDDSAIAGRIWMTIADIHLRKEAYEEALMAALHVPVFYGSQGSLVPQAELFAARCLVKMERFEDARGFYERIIQAYPGSESENVAKKELAPIAGLQNKAEQAPTSPAAPTAPTETPPAETPPTAS